MCVFGKSGVPFSAFILVIPIILLLSTTFYQQLVTLKNDVEEAKENCAKNMLIEATQKNVKKIIERLKEDFKVSQFEIRKLKDEVKLYKTDKTGMIDYAYGGSVITSGNTETIGAEGLSLFGIKVCRQSYLEKRILENSVLPGDCWPIRGHEGSVIVQLIETIFVTKLTLEHASRELLPNSSMASAPKELSLWGLQDESFESGSPHFFGNFEYSSTGPEVQTFFVPNQSVKPFKLVEFKVHSNYGHPEFTCVYRLRIHGHT